ncbi:MAG: hypothetical protein NG737_07785 [Omnitrophica bacterium]|nr:hypothetical protein [Candidatus Omnitrophota bacterium]
MKQLVCLIVVIFLSFGFLLPIHSQSARDVLEVVPDIKGKLSTDVTPKSVTSVDQGEQNFERGNPAADSLKIDFPESDKELFVT